ESYKPSPDAPEATVLASPVGVRFSLDGRDINMDRTSPYYVNAWEIPKLSEGYHTLEAFTEYNNGDDLDAPGVIGYATRRTIIHVINSTFITDFDVVDSNGSKLMDLVEGSIIDLNQPEFNSFNIIANPSISSIRSVKFTLNNVTARIDNGAPYALGGNPILGDTHWKVRVENYTLSATPYMKYFAWGPNGTPLTIHFQVVKGIAAGSTLANARVGNSIQANEEVLATEASEIVWSVYPVPAKDELHIRLEGKLDGTIYLNLINLQGQVMHATQGPSEIFRDYIISTEKLGLNPGLYLVQIQQANGRRFIQKIAKQ
ncbi:MAG: T9SS type A sorting domain-containing protein, partial [Chryseolinea sp.]